MTKEREIELLTELIEAQEQIVRQYWRDWDNCQGGKSDHELIKSCAEYAEKELAKWRKQLADLED